MGNVVAGVVFDERALKILVISIGVMCLASASLGVAITRAWYETIHQKPVRLG